MSEHQNETAVPRPFPNRLVRPRLKRISPVTRVMIADKAIRATQSEISEVIASPLPIREPRFIVRVTFLAKYLRGQKNIDCYVKGSNLKTNRSEAEQFSFDQAEAAKTHAIQTAESTFKNGKLVGAEIIPVEVHHD